MKSLFLLPLVLALATVQAGCRQEEPKSERKSLVDRVQAEVEAGLAEARKELATKPLELNAGGQPEATIAADGTFRIAGKEVEVTPEQRALLQAYHKELLAVAESGIEIGGQAAALAGTAVKEALANVFTGDEAAIEAKVEAEARKIASEAMKLCDHLEGLRAAQDRVAEALPAFRPYARLDQAEIEECRKDAAEHG
ncbi:DUF2884 family protein [Vulcaniibacterium gelatinicum]|uniref:DUF2884 family protein n=1 Tax=Vulcaniibacterium gelatinicum TaxID=2598725 RepID=UPI0011CCB4B8|nr:DUF2884 family protein [Vulcaniibacterium gelatinicum]